MPPEFLDEGTVTVDVGPPEVVTDGQGVDASEVHTAEPDASCACRSDGAPAPLALLALLGLRRGRRRR
ncbi:MYXO-CTERM sorting domain-containing protein [Nannocystis pusilla]